MSEKNLPLPIPYPAPEPSAPRETPPIPAAGVARSMTTGGGQTWVWRNTGTTWYCISNV